MKDRLNLATFFALNRHFFVLKTAIAKVVKKSETKWVNSGDIETKNG